MESGYDGLVASEKKYGDKIKVQMIENINYADMDQALTNLATGNDLVIGVGGQTQAAVYKIAKRFPKVKFSIVGGNEAEALPNVAGYDVKQAEIAFAAGAAAAMLSKNGAVSYVGGLEIPSIVNAGKEFGNGARYVNANIKYFENYTGDFDDVAKSKEATLAAIAQGADVHYHILNLGLRGMEQAAKDKGTHIIGSYTDRCGSDPLYVAYSITGVGFPGAIRDRSGGERRLEARLQGVRLENGSASFGHDYLRRHPGAESQTGRHQEGYPRGQDQSPQGLRRDRAMLTGSLAVRDPTQTLAEPLLALQNVTKRFGSLLAVSDASLDIMPGEVHCILGENGAGKSTLCNLIFGVHVPDQGTMRFRGEVYHPTGPSDALASGIAMVHQHFSLVHDMTVVDNVILGQQRGFVNTKAWAKRLERLAHDYGFALDPYAKIDDLSVGERQRVEIVKCLIREPRLFVLDEPTAVLLPDEIAALLDICRRVAAGGAAVVLVTHKLAEIKKAADRVTVLRGGRVVARSEHPAEEIDALVRAMIQGDVKSLDKSAASILGVADPERGRAGTGAQRNTAA